MSLLRLSSDLVVESLDDADTAIFVSARGETHVVDSIGTAILRHLQAGHSSEESLLILLENQLQPPVDSFECERYLAALVALWRDAGILKT